MDVVGRGGGWKMAAWRTEIINYNNYLILIVQDRPKGTPSRVRLSP
jgi:hypothetical protein